MFQDALNGKRRWLAITLRLGSITPAASGAGGHWKKSK